MKRKVLMMSLVAVPALLITGFVTTKLTVSAADNDSGQSTIFDRVAQILNISKDDLDAAFKQAHTEKVDQKVADGELTQEQADKIKERIESGDFGPGRGKGGMRGPGKMMEYAEEYLGKTREEIRSELESGKSLGQIIEESGKTTDEAKSIILAKVQADVAEKVASGDITEERAEEILSNLSEKIDNFFTFVPGERFEERMD